MRAVVLHEYGGPEKLKFEDNVPEPQVSESTVLIAAAAASVNPIDWKLRSGMRQKDFPLSFPAIPGRLREWRRAGGRRKCEALQGRRPRSCAIQHDLCRVGGSGRFGRGPSARRFTFYWPEGDHWQGADFVVHVPLSNPSTW
jgi:hypothetical protein